MSFTWPHPLQRQAEGLIPGQAAHRRPARAAHHSAVQPQGGARLCGKKGAWVKLRKFTASCPVTSQVIVFAWVPQHAGRPATSTTGGRAAKWRARRRDREGPQQRYSLFPWSLWGLSYAVKSSTEIRMASGLFFDKMPHNIESNLIRKVILFLMKTKTIMS